MILIIFAWLYCFLLNVCLGAGMLKAISKFTRRSIPIQFGTFYQFWLGFATLIGLLQVISLFLPINNVAFTLVSLLAACAAAWNFKFCFGQVSLFFKFLSTVRGILSFSVVCIILILISYSANKGVTLPDTLLYHFNAVKWAKEYPAVPGLVNLHNRLGFNSSFFLFAAFTEIGLYAGHSAHVALSFIMVVAIIHWFFVVSDSREVMSKRIFCMMTFLFLLVHAFYRVDIASLSTDYPMAILMLVFCTILLDKFEHKILLLLPISAVVFSFKISGMLVIAAGLAALLGNIFVLKYEYKNPKERKTQIRLVAATFILFCFVISGFVIRNVIVSGWLVYPFPVGNLHLPWSVSKPYVLDMIDWIKSYPKMPGGASPETIKGHDFFYWFIPWFDKFKKSLESTMFGWSLLIILWSMFQVRSLARFIYARLNILLLSLFSIASIILWFVSAPDMRFGSVYFFILFATSIVLLFEGSKYKKVLKVFVYIVFIYQVVGQIPAYYIDRLPNLFTFAYVKPRELKRVIASPPDQNPPLYIYMPAKGNKCGNSPIPCTPYAGGMLHNHQLIRQRVPGDLSKGFLPPDK